MQIFSVEVGLNEIQLSNNLLINLDQYTNLASLYNITESHSYIPYTGCVLDHILHNDTLTDQQKLFYLLADSLSLISSKNNTLHRSATLSSTGWAHKLNCSKSEILSMQKKMEEKGYFMEASPILIYISKTLC